MAINFKRLDKNNKEEYNKIKKIYFEAFPKEERIPLYFLKLKSKKENIDFLNIYDEETWIGFIYIVSYKDISFISFLAIDKSFRGKGYGSKVLKNIIEKYKNNRIILNIEEIDVNADNYMQRLKRKKFYEKNGFKDNNLKIKEVKIMYEMMYYKDKVSRNEYDKIMEYFLGKFIYYFIKEN